MVLQEKCEARCDYRQSLTVPTFGQDEDALLAPRLDRTIELTIGGRVDVHLVLGLDKLEEKGKCQESVGRGEVSHLPS